MDLFPAHRPGEICFRRQPAAKLNIFFSLTFLDSHQDVIFFQCHFRAFTSIRGWTFLMGNQGVEGDFGSQRNISSPLKIRPQNFNSPLKVVI